MLRAVKTHVSKIDSIKNDVGLLDISDISESVTHCQQSVGGGQWEGQNA